MTPKTPEKKSEGFIPASLDLLLADAQILAHQYFPRFNAVGIEDTLHETGKDKKGSSLAEKIGLMPLVVRMDPVNGNAYHGMVDTSYSQDDINGFVSFSEDLFYMIMDKLGYSSFTEGSKEKFGQIVRNLMERISIEGKEKESKHSLRMIYLFSPSFFMMSLFDPNRVSSNDTINREYPFKDLQESEIDRNATRISITDIFDRGIRPGYNHVVYDNGSERIENKIDDAGRVSSLINYLSSCIGKSNEHLSKGDYGEAASPLIRFLNASYTSHERMPLLLSPENKKIFSAIMGSVEELASFYTTADSLSGTFDSKSEGNGRAMTQEDLDIVGSYLRRELTSGEIAELTSVTKPTKEELLQYNPDSFWDEAERTRIELMENVNFLVQKMNITIERPVIGQPYKPQDEPREYPIGN